MFMNVFWFALFLILLSFVVSLGSFISYLMVLENLKVLLLISCLLLDEGGSHMMFLMLLVVLTLEVSFGLMILCRLWSFSSLIDTVTP